MGRIFECGACVDVWGRGDEYKGRMEKWIWVELRGLEGGWVGKVGVSMYVLCIT